MILFLLLAAGSKVKAQVSDTVCHFFQTKVYRVNPTPGSLYFWSVECGAIVSSDIHADSIVVVWCKTPGTYKVKVVELARSGCWGDTVSTTVIVNPKMHLEIFGPAELCVGAPVWLYASGADSYLWNTGQTTSNINANLKDTNTTFQVIGRNFCETDTASFTVKVNPRPTASFTYSPQNPIVNETISLNYTGKSAADWTWYIDNQQVITGNVKNPEISFYEKGRKEVELVAMNQFGCSDTTIYTLTVGYDFKIFVPNVFSPDGNGINDSFKAIGFNIKSIHMQIFNRWGEKIYESFGVNDAWDGTFKGQVVMDGVYIYAIDAEAIDGEHAYLHGNVTVMK